MPTLDDIPPAVRALLPAIDLACLGIEVDHGTLLHLEYETVFEQPQPETAAWIEAAVTANPGVWMSRLCRAMHNLPETYRSVAGCGQCAGGYANPRKRKRAARLQTNLLPGFEQSGGAYHLHPPCSQRDLSWLRRQVYRLERQGRLSRRREKRPDLRQPRGWDLMTTLYPVETDIGSP